MTAPSRRRLGRALAVGVGFLLVALIAAVNSARRYQAGLERARGLVAAGRFAEARPWLAAQATGKTVAPELAYMLGVCEHAAERPGAALEAWRRGPADPPLAPPPPPA